MEVGGGGGGGVGFFPYFPPLKPRCVLWSGVSYSPKNTVNNDSDNNCHLLNKYCVLISFSQWPLDNYLHFMNEVSEADRLGKLSRPSSEKLSQGWTPSI